jgi:hypothetical protein
LKAVFSLIFFGNYKVHIHKKTTTTTHQSTEQKEEEKNMTYYGVGDAGLGYERHKKWRC